MKPILSCLFFLSISLLAIGQQEFGVSFQSGSLRIEGTMSLPAGNGPFPLVIFMHEFGPKDRDARTVIEGELICYTPAIANQTVRTFEDMADAFAQNGIASLRYDKRTLTHAATLDGRLLRPYNFVQDAQFAVEFAKTRSEVDPDCIVMVGHGQGALLIPKIGRGVAGLISLAGIAASLDTTFAVKRRYFEEKCKGNPNAGDEVYQQTLDDFAEIRACMWPPNEPINGAFPDFWKSWSFMQDSVMEIYNVAALPSLFIHGTQDLEVAVSDIDRFANKVNGNVTDIRIFGGLTHYLTKVNTTNVDQAVLDTMINWIKTTKQRTPVRDLYTAEDTPSFQLYTTAEGIQLELLEPGLDIEEVGVHDLQGRQLLLHRNLRSQQYLIPRPSTGIYIVTFVADGRQLSRKIWVND